MSSKVTDGGGLGEIFRKIMAPQAPAKEQPASREATQAKMEADSLSLGSTVPSRLQLAATEGSQPPSARSLVNNAQDLNDLIRTIGQQEFPGLKLSPRQAAGLASFIRNELEARGINDKSFKELQQGLQA